MRLSITQSKVIVLWQDIKKPSFLSRGVLCGIMSLLLLVLSAWIFSEIRHANRNSHFEFPTARELFIARTLQVIGSRDPWSSHILNLEHVKRILNSRPEIPKGEVSVRNEAGGGVTVHGSEEDLGVLLGI